MASHHENSVGTLQMNLAEEFMQGKVACEVDGCTRVAKSAVKDFGLLYGLGPFPVDSVQIGPTHFFCDAHKREGYSFKRANGQWVRF
ncbi:MAG: hypothetical protein ABR865_15555 [Terracidiphilus sp.]